MRENAFSFAVPTRTKGTLATAPDEAADTLPASPTSWAGNTVPTRTKGTLATAPDEAADTLPASPTSSLLERLRSQIRSLEAQPRELVLALRTGLPEVDGLGAFRLGGGVELCGEEASGRTTLALSLVAAAGRQQRLSAWVDGPAELYPPAALCLGVELSRLLIVRPRAPRQLVWSAVQLLRSGAFTCVVLDVTHTGVVPSPLDCKKLLDAARAGGSLLVLLTSLATPGQGLVRLTLRLHRPSPARPAGSHLRCLEGGLAEEDEGVAYELDAPRGRRTRVQRARLTRDEVPVRRAGAVEAVPRPMRVVAAEESLRRPRKNLERDGYPGLGAAQGRPGREGPLRLPAQLQREAGGAPGLGAALPAQRSWR